ncbi:Uncharacterised protein [uncultured archaeon]|nr:Uncharacterised protein [uncultured archaeon]
MNSVDLPHADQKVIAVATAMAQKLAAREVFVPLGVDIKSSEKPLVLVHPFYYGEEESRRSYYEVFFENDYWWNMPRENYLENVKSFLSSFQGNIYLYESDFRLPTTKRILLATRKSFDGVYFIKTLRDESNPSDLLMLGRDADYLKDISSRFLFAGGRVVKYTSKHKMDGCLGGLVARFNDSGINGDFVKGCCFT